MPENTWRPGENGYWRIDRRGLSINEGGRRGITLVVNWGGEFSFWYVAIKWGGWWHRWAGFFNRELQRQYKEGQWMLVAALPKFPDEEGESSP